MTKITIDQIEEINNKTIIMVSRMLKFIQQNYYLNDKLMKVCLLDMLKAFSEAYELNQTEESKYCHENLLSVIDKLYPGEIQKELLKH